MQEAQRDDAEVVKKAHEIQMAIEEGAVSFLNTEYRYMGIFMAIFAIFIFLLLSSEDGFQTEVSQEAARLLSAPVSCCPPPAASLSAPS